MKVVPAMTYVQSTVSCQAFFSTPCVPNNSAQRNHVITGWKQTVCHFTTLHRGTHISMSIEYKHCHSKENTHWEHKPHYHSTAWIGFWIRL